MVTALRPWIEVALVCAAGFIPFVPLPIVAMLAVASVLRWVSGGSWAEMGGGPIGRDISLGCVIGACAFVAVSLAAGSSGAAGDLAIVRGNSDALLVVIVLSLALAAASEMVFRGFILSRVAGAVGDNPHLGNLVAALAYGITIGAPHGFAATAGAAVSGLGFGLLYIASGRRLALPIAAHAAFDLSAVAAAFLQL